MKLANRGEADIKKSLSQDAAFLCKKISLNPMLRCMRSLYKDLDFSVKISKKPISLVSLKVRLVLGHGSF